jgi:hypothetical protein
MAFKWTGILIAVVTVALGAMANLLIATMTTVAIPAVVNASAVGLAVVGALVAFIAHLHERTTHKLEHLTNLVVGRVDDLENRIGDRNSGFVEGYMLGHGPEAPVVPLSPRGLSRRAVTSADD